ncbi:group II intron reverse transcriptase/maturase [Saccharopolyspora spinosa]|uniref:Group II intron reverse transcriptase/maturase n=1 Tax=Saccharopolyspora spinosa TaxID=60894 RepID=A0A2N3Y6V6_SACSN|nr:group II intron reverse transcriptase/maturase [Saccharopolyspora spinosa]PKW18659.1 group II intron reverse transcriptase/maturase [Saccharopolyspora spinosa]
MATRHLASGLPVLHDPATLIVAFNRVAGNQGARTAGVDGLTAFDVERDIGALEFLDGLRSDVKSGEFRPLPVKERKIPKPGGSGKLRNLGIPTVADRIVQSALKLVLEPIFEADFLPISYGFRPKRRAQDAIAEIQRFGTKGYLWVLDADIEACFDEISQPALMDRVRARVKDKRVLALVKAFLKAGIMTESGSTRETHTGTPQGGILSPLLANIALSALDEHWHRDWLPGGRMESPYQRRKRRRHGQANWRIVRYADDFAILVHCSAEDTRSIQDEVAQVLEPLGLKLSQAKTRIVNMADGFSFLGFHIQWRRKPGSTKWYVYTFIADRPIRSVKDKIRALTRRTSQADPKDVLIRLNQIVHGWANYFRHAVAKYTFHMLGDFLWRRVIMWLKTNASLVVEGHPQAASRPARGLVADHRGRHRVDQLVADTADHPVPLPRQHDPQPLANLTTTRPQQPWRARCSVMGTPGSASGLEKRTGGNTGTALQADSTDIPTPACDTTPRPSALTLTRFGRLLPFTCEVSSRSADWTLNKSHFPLRDRHFALLPIHVTPTRAKQLG